MLKDKTAGQRPILAKSRGRWNHPALTTDQKVGGSSPSGRAAETPAIAGVSVICCRVRYSATCPWEPFSGAMLSCRRLGNVVGAILSHSKKRPRPWSGPLLWTVSVPLEAHDLGCGEGMEDPRLQHPP